MISAVRDQALALVCLRHDVPAVEGRGIDSLPTSTTEAFAATLVRSLDAAELRRAFRLTGEALRAEIEAVDAVLAIRLAGPLRELTT